MYIFNLCESTYVNKARVNVVGTINSSDGLQAHPRRLVCNKKYLYLKAEYNHNASFHCCIFHRLHFQTDIKIHILTRQDVDQPVLKFVDWQVCTHKSRRVGLYISQFLQKTLETGE